MATAGTFGPSLEFGGTVGCEHARRDLAAAGQLQRMMLPPATVNAGGWTATYRYEPAGAVSGDYVDLVPDGDRLYFMLGDVSVANC